MKWICWNWLNAGQTIVVSPAGAPSWCNTLPMHRCSYCFPRDLDEIAFVCTILRLSSHLRWSLACPFSSNESRYKPSKPSFFSPLESSKWAIRFIVRCSIYLSQIRTPLQAIHRKLWTTFKWQTASELFLNEPFRSSFEAALEPHWNRFQDTFDLLWSQLDSSRAVITPVSLQTPLNRRLIRQFSRTASNCEHLLTINRASFGNYFYSFESGHFRKDGTSMIKRQNDVQTKISKMVPFWRAPARSVRSTDEYPV